MEVGYEGWKIGSIEESKGEGRKVGSKKRRRKKDIKEKGLV